ncbi:MAG: DNA recombination protein RmuC [Oscillospiraceae bacterium]|nr:DNA recombination protein RmuC [Oscillospiraceae bacterium]
METFEIILLAVLLVIVIIDTVLLLRFSAKDKQDDSGELLALIEENNKRLSGEITSVGASVKLLNDILSQNQRDMNQATLSQLRQLEERFKTLETTNEQKLTAMREAITTHLTAMSDSNNHRLEEIRKTVDEKLQESIEERMNRSFRRVSESLEEVYKGIGEMKTLASDVGSLKKVLSNVKTRGIMGEIQLGAILSEILAPEQYDTDIATIPQSQNRVEYAIKLPGDDGGHVYLPVDSKFPADCYLALQEAQESGNREAIDAAASVLISRIKSFAKDIKTKYVEVPYTTSFAIMFLPFEGLYSEVVSRGLVEILQRDYSVNIAGPSTMAALLNSLQMGFKTLAIQKRSDEVWQVLSAVKSEFEKFEEVLASAQKHIDLVGKDIDKLVGVRTRAIHRRLRDVQSLESDEQAKKLLDYTDI